MATALANRPVLRLVEHRESYMPDNDKSEQDTEKSTNEPYTRTPNAIFDQLLTEIDNLAELKITMAICRKTYGWLDKSTGERKESDVISFTQFEELTGLSRAMVKAGLEKGKKRGSIICVEEGPRRYRYSLDLVNYQRGFNPSKRGQHLNPPSVHSMNQSPIGSENEPTSVHSIDRSSVHTMNTQKKDLKKFKNNTATSVADAAPVQTEKTTPNPSPDKKVTDPITPVLFAIPAKNGDSESGPVGSQKPKKKPEVKERDPTLDYFAVVAWREMNLTVTEGRDGAWPNPVQREMLVSSIPDTPADRERWQKVLRYWARHNYQMRNIPQLLDVFFNGNGKKPGKT